MTRLSLALLLFVKCGLAWAEYGDYGDYGNDEGYYLEGSTKGGSGYNYGDAYDKKGKDRYGYESHSEYGRDGDGENGSYESSYSYGQEDKPVRTAYSYSSSNGSPYDGPSYDYEGDFDATKMKTKQASPFEPEAQPERTFPFDDAAGVYNFDVPNPYSRSSNVFGESASVFNDAKEALKSVQLHSRTSVPDFGHFYPPNEDS